MISDKTVPNTGSLFSAILLVAGCCIGGGMLALPIATGTLGFAPSIAMMLLVWFAMTATGLLLVEASLWFEEGAHMVTMATRLLGPAVRIIAWALYIYICYASLVAYTSIGGDLLEIITQKISFFPANRVVNNTLFILVFGFILYLGNSFVGKINSIFFMGMMAAYGVLVLVSIPEIDLVRLRYQEWQGASLAMPLLLTSFSFQTVVPSLTPYLKRNVAQLRIAIIAGTLTALVIYIIWQTIILGMIPVEGIYMAQKNGMSASHVLLQFVTNPLVKNGAYFFAFFAIITSFLGIAMGLFDFLSDALSISRKGKGELTIAALVLLPTLLIAIQYKKAFLVALETSGGIGDSILNGIIPVLMVWKGRYQRGYGGIRGIRGGKSLLFILGVFYVFVALQEVLVLTGVMDALSNYFRTLDY